jgi:hypothetical protein
MINIFKKMFSFILKRHLFTSICILIFCYCLNRNISFAQDGCINRLPTVLNETVLPTHLRSLCHFVKNSNLEYASQEVENGVVVSNDKTTLCEVNECQSYRAPYFVVEKIHGSIHALKFFTSQLTSAINTRTELNHQLDWKIRDFQKIVARMKLRINTPRTNELSEPKEFTFAQFHERGEDKKPLLRVSWRQTGRGGPQNLVYNDSIWLTLSEKPKIKGEAVNTTYIKIPFASRQQFINFPTLDIRIYKDSPSSPPLLKASLTDKAGTVIVQKKELLNEAWYDRNMYFKAGCYANGNNSGGGKASVLFESIGVDLQR